jgi:hypothetical protein
MINLALFVEGLEVPEEVIGLNAEKIERAAYRAINLTATRARTMAADEIRRQVNFPTSYLNPAEGRLTVANTAGPGDLQAMILGRHRPTSLARFVTRGTPGKTGVDVTVKPGKSDEMKRAFIMKLKSGTGGIDTASNLGLAIRVERGTRPTKAWKPVRVSDGLYLLYGPSVDQVFQSVRTDITPEADRILATEFERLIALEQKG